MNIFKYDILYDGDYQQSDEERRRIIKENRENKINDILGIDCEKNAVIDNRQKVLNDILPIKEKQSFLSRILSKIKKL